MTLVSGSAGNGKTQLLVEHAAERYASNPFAPTLVDLPPVFVPLPKLEPGQVRAVAA